MIKDIKIENNILEWSVVKDKHVQDNNIPSISKVIDLAISI